MGNMEALLPTIALLLSTAALVVGPLMWFISTISARDKAAAEILAKQTKAEFDKATENLISFTKSHIHNHSEKIKELELDMASQHAKIYSSINYVKANMLENRKVITGLRKQLQKLQEMHNE